MFAALVNGSTRLAFTGRIETLQRRQSLSNNQIRQIKQALTDPDVFVRLDRNPESPPDVDHYELIRELA
jgi:hypothetical protein